MISRGLLVVLALGLGSALASRGGAAAAPAGEVGTGAIAGRVSFSGTVPPPRRLMLSADPKCAALHKDGIEARPVKVKDGGLTDVLVYVKTGIGTSHASAPEATLLDQVGCEYQPSMVVLLAGQPLRIRNSDDTLHNIHPRPSINKEFNIGQPRKGMEVTRSFEQPELMIPTGCDVHPWMRAHISVLSNPFFAVTNDDGSYEIRALPDGDYEVAAVHSLLKGVTAKVSVKDGKTSRLDLALVD